jgi:Ca2+-binding EF-hand superfamily protein
MAALRQQFEADLKAKLSQKSSAHTTEESVLIKAFKYFDLDNSGTVSQKEWLQTLERVGINSVDRQGLLTLFDAYDADKSGALDY